MDPGDLSFLPFLFSIKNPERENKGIVHESWYEQRELQKGKSLVLSFLTLTLAQIMTEVFIHQNKIILSKKNTIILLFNEKDLHFLSWETASGVKYLPR